MNFGDGVAVNWAVDCKNSDNGMLAEMQNNIQSGGDSSNSSDDIVILDSNVSIRDMLSTYENKENIPDNETFVSLQDPDAPVFSTSLNEPIGPILKAAMETVVEPNIVKIPKKQQLPAAANLRYRKSNIPDDQTFVSFKDPDAPVFSTSLNEPIGPILKSAMETVVEPDIVKIPIKQQLPAATNLQHRQYISCGIEESTKMMLVDSPGYCETHFGNDRNYSVTDSDIQVLMSEEIVDSDWSAGKTVTDKLNSLKKVNVSKNIKNSTDQEMSVGNSSSSSLSNSEQTGKDQLLKVISEQATYIKSLESTLGRYRETYKTLLKHVDALRLTLNEKNIEMGAIGRDKPSEHY